MELIKFIFSDFWHWLGAFVFLVIIVDGIFVNFFRVIIHALKWKQKVPERDPMDFPEKAPQGTIWPRYGEKYIFINGTWIQLTGTLLKDYETKTKTIISTGNRSKECEL